MIEAETVDVVERERERLVTVQVQERVWVSHVKEPHLLFTVSVAADRRRFCYPSLNVYVSQFLPLAFVPTSMYGPASSLMRRIIERVCYR